MKKLKIPNRDKPRVCHPCATANGAMWPEGHMATWSYTLCDYCMDDQQELKGTCSISDWNWPGGAYAGRREL